MPDFSGKPEIIIPRSQLSWLLDQPDNILSTSEFHYETLEGDYAFTNPHILKDPYHEHVVHKYLPRNLSKLVPAIQDEMEHSINTSWGFDTESWKEITVWTNLMYIISYATNRMFVGLPLCRNDEYLENMRSFAMDIIASSSLLSFVPTWLKPIVGPIVTIPNRRHWAATAKFTRPLIDARKESLKRKQEDPAFKWEEPNDYIGWTLSLATAENRQDELNADLISRRLMAINFAAIHTTTITATNLFFDLFSVDPSKGYVEGIREEAEQVFREEGGRWTKAGLQRLHRADSAIRESMRISNFMSRNITRIVIADKGITNTAEGWHAPKGAYVSADVTNTMHDPEIYPDPNVYDAFRYSRPREESEARGVSEKGKVDGASLKNVDMINTSDTFLTFSHGRHACPGRFFVALELKMMLAYVLLNYDVEHLETRPKNTWFNTASVPDSKGSIRVKRKVGTVKV